MKISLPVFAFALLLLWQPLTGKAEELPTGFEEAIVNESAGDQGFDLRQKSPEKLQPDSKARQAAEADAFIRRVILHSELYGVEAPLDESGCHKATASRADFEACREKVEKRSGVLSSRLPNRKKQRAAEDYSEDKKSAINFTAE